MHTHREGEGEGEEAEGGTKHSKAPQARLALTQPNFKQPDVPRNPG